jgi:copper transport protein
VAAGSISLVALGLAAMWPYAGHASAGDLVPLAFVADWVHVAAMATWLGGLTVLLIGPLRNDAPATDTFRMLAGFSEWALNAVTLIVATGLFAAWRNVRVFGALTATHYGRLLLWKTGIVVLVVVIARLSRRHAEGLDRRGGAPLPVLRRTVLAEASGAVAVLAITAFLTGSAQASQTYGPAFTRAATHDGITVTVHVDRTHVGVAHLLVSTDRGGAVQPMTSVTGSLAELDPRLGPFPITLRIIGRGRALGTFAFPEAGVWSLTLDVETTSHMPISVATTVRVRG